MIPLNLFTILIKVIIKPLSEYNSLGQDSLQFIFIAVWTQISNKQSGA